MMNVVSMSSYIGGPNYRYTVHPEKILLVIILVIVIIVIVILNEQTHTQNKHDHTRKDPNMAMEDRKCQMSWSSKNDSRMQSLLCSRDSAGVFCQERKTHSELMPHDVGI